MNKYQIAYESTLAWLEKERDSYAYKLDEINADLEDEEVPSIGTAKLLVRCGARLNQINEVIRVMKDALEEEEG